MDSVGIYNPYPGDIIRDKETMEDYVVYTVGALATGAFIYQGVSLYERNLKEWRTDLYAPVKLIKSNLTQDIPQDIIQQVEATIGQVANFKGTTINPQNIYANTAEAAFFRDMLLISSSIDNYNDKMIDLARALVGTTERSWSAEDIYDALYQEATKNGVSEEALADFSEQLAVQSKTFNHLKVASSSSDINFLETLLSPTETGGGANTTLRQLDNLFKNKALIESNQAMPSSYKASKSARRAFNDILTGKNFYQSQKFKSTQDSAISMANDLIAFGGGKGLSPDVQRSPKLLKLLKEVTKAIQSGKEVPNSLFEALQTLPGAERFFSYLDIQERYQLRSKHRATRQSQYYSVKNQYGYVPASASQLQTLGETHPVVGFRTRDYIENYVQTGRPVRYKGEIFDLTTKEGLENFTSKGTELFKSDNLLLVHTQEAAKHLKTDRNSLIDLDEVLSESSRLMRELDHSNPNNHLLSSYLVRNQASLLAFKRSTEVDADLGILSAARNLKRDMKGAGSLDYLPQPEDGLTRVYMSVNSKNRVRHSRDLADLVETSEGMYYYTDLSRQRLEQLEQSNTPSAFMQDLKQVFPRQRNATNSIDGLVQHLEEVLAIESPVINRTAKLSLDLDNEVYGSRLFSRGYQQAQLAFAPIKNSKHYQVISSNLGDLENQFELAQQYYGGTSKVGILDIETTPSTRITTNTLGEDIEEKIWEITNSGFVDVRESTQELLQEVEDIRKQVASGAINKKEAGDALVKVGRSHQLPLLYQGFKVNGSDQYYQDIKKYIQELVTEMEKYDVVVTQTAADYKFLSDQLEYIPSHLLSDFEKRKLKDRLLKIKNSKALDATFITGFTGEQSLAQNNLSQKLLSKVEIHVSTSDATNLMEILDATKESFEKISSTLERTKDGKLNVQFSFNQGSWVTLPNNRDPVFRTDTVKLLNLRTMTNSEVEVVYQTQTGVINTIRLNQNQLANMLRGSKISGFKEVQDHLTQEIIDQRAKYIRDQANRMFRNLNTLNDTMSYPYTNMNSKALTNKSKAIHALRVKSTVEKLKQDAGFVGELEQRFSQLSPEEKNITKIKQETYQYLKDISFVDTGGLDTPNPDSIFSRELEKITAIDQYPEEYFDTYVENVAEELANQYSFPLLEEVHSEFFSAFGSNQTWYEKLLFEPKMEGVLDAFHFKVLQEAPKTTTTSNGFIYSLKMFGVDKLTRQAELDYTRAFEFSSTIKDYILNANLYANNGNKAALNFFGGAPGIELDDELLNELKFNNPEYQRDLGYSAFVRKYPTLPEHFNHLVNHYVTKDIKGLDSGDESFILKPFEELLQSKPDGSSERTQIAELLEDLRKNLSSLTRRLKSDEVIKLEAVDASMQDTLLEWSTRGEDRLDLLKSTREIVDSLGNVGGDEFKENFGRVFDSMKNTYISSDNPIIKELLDDQDTHELTVADAFKLLVDQSRDAEGNKPIEYEDTLDRLKLLLSPNLPGAKRFKGHQAVPMPNIPTGSQQVTHAAVNKAMGVGSQVDANVSATAQGVRQFVSNMTSKNLAENKFLVLAAAAASFLAFKKSNITSEYSAGNESEQSADLNDLNSVSEVPGGTGSVPFSGQAGAFTLDVDIKSYVRNQQEKDKVVQTVYEAVSNTTSFRKTSTNIRTSPDNDLKKRLERYYGPAFK